MKVCLTLETCKICFKISDNFRNISFPFYNRSIPAITDVSNRHQWRRLLRLDQPVLLGPNESSWNSEQLWKWIGNLVEGMVVGLHLLHDRNIDPHGLPIVTASSYHCFHTCCPYVHFSRSSQTKQISSENNWRDCGSGRVDHYLMSPVSLHLLTICFFRTSLTGTNMQRFVQH